MDTIRQWAALEVAVIVAAFGRRLDAPRHEHVRRARQPEDPETGAQLASFGLTGLEDQLGRRGYPQLAPHARRMVVTVVVTNFAVVVAALAVVVANFAVVMIVRAGTGEDDASMLERVYLAEHQRRSRSRPHGHDGPAVEALTHVFGVGFDPLSGRLTTVAVG